LTVPWVVAAARQRHSRADIADDAALSACGGQGPSAHCTLSRSPARPLPAARGR
jgi:hypothetical protein